MLVTRKVSIYCCLANTVNSSAASSFPIGAVMMYSIGIERNNVMAKLQMFWYTRISENVNRQKYMVCRNIDFKQIKA